MATNKATGKQYGPYSEEERQAFMDNPSTSRIYRFEVIEEVEPAPEPKEAKKAKKKQKQTDDDK